MTYSSMLLVVIEWLDLRLKYVAVYSAATQIQFIVRLSFLLIKQFAESMLKHDSMIHCIF